MQIQSSQIQYAHTELHGADNSGVLKVALKTLAVGQNACRAMAHSNLKRIL
jgi:hypothetical protein